MAERVLIIDDEPGIRNSLCSYLKLEEYQVDTAENGKEALEKMRADKYSIVLLDINMPGMSGIDTLQAIKSFDFSCQVIMKTGAATVQKTM
jgi:DNA-binding NtrC family response regulator